MSQKMSANNASDYKILSPTGSYQIEVPAEAIVDDNDDAVLSVWLPDSELLLQASSYKRTEGEQVSSKERARGRMESGELFAVRQVDFVISSCPDVTAFVGKDSEEVTWYYVYAVWPDLAILCTISGAEAAIERDGQWAFRAVQFLKRES